MKFFLLLLGVPPGRETNRQTRQKNIRTHTCHNNRVTKGDLQKTAKIIQHDLQFYEEAKQVWKTKYKNLEEKEEKEVVDSRHRKKTFDET